MRACFDHYGKKNWGERGGGRTVRRPLPMLRPCGLFRLLNRFPFVKKNNNKKTKQNKTKQRKNKQTNNTAKSI